MNCPKCLSFLYRSEDTPPHISCKKCGGRWVSFNRFMERLGNYTMLEEFLNYTLQNHSEGRACPCCLKKSKSVVAPFNRLDSLEFENFRTRYDKLGEAYNNFKSQVNPKPEPRTGITFSGSITDWTELAATWWEYFNFWPVQKRQILKNLSSQKQNYWSV